MRNSSCVIIIFIADPEGNVIGVGFDYDENSYFEPFKFQFVEKHIISSTASGWEGNKEFEDFNYAVLKYINNGKVYYQDTDSFDGMFLEPTFRDSLFDIWKTEFSGSSSKLMKETMGITSQQFVTSLSAEKIIGDISWQVLSLAMAYAIGKVVAIGTSALAVALTAGSVAAEAGESTPAGPIGAAIGFVVGFFLTYWLTNSIWAYTQYEDSNAFVIFQTTYNEEYENTETLSEKWWDDRYYGSIMPNTLQGTVRGIYTSVRAETDKHIFEGQVILAPRGVDKTTAFGTKFIHIDLDYSQQTRSYLAYSDLGDPLVNSFFYQETEELYGIPIDSDFVDDIKVIQPRDPRALYMENSIMFVEDAIYKATKDNDGYCYDSTIPYMISVEPTLQFADSSEMNVPEFYLGCPIYVDHETYETVKDEYYHIYKVYNGTTNIIQLIPKDSIEHRMFMSDIVSIVPYYTDSLGNTRTLDTYLALKHATEFTFDNCSGQLKLKSSYASYLDDYLSYMDTLYGDIEGYDRCIILEVSVEKYRDISVERSYISQEKVHQIATMQSVHADILEYLYQFTVAQNTQLRLSEIAYTAFVTVISTALSIPLTMGMDCLFDKFWNWAALSSNVNSVLEKTAISIISRTSQTTSIGLNTLKFIYALFAETMEELYIDPWIDAYVANAVADCGGSQFEQILLSTLAETGRETFMSSVVDIMKEGLSLMQENLYPQAQMLNKIVQEASQRNLQLSETTSEGIQMFISTILIFSGALAGGFGGSGLAALGSMLIVSGDLVDELVGLKKFYTDLLQLRHQRRVLGAEIANLGTYVANQKLLKALDYQIATLRKSNRLTPTPDAFEKAVYVARSDTSRIMNFMRDHKKGLTTAAVAVVAGIISFIFPVTAPFLSAAPITIGMVGDFKPRKKIKLELNKDPKSIATIEKDSLTKLFKFLKFNKKTYITQHIFKDSIINTDILKNKINSESEFNAIRPLESRITIFTHNAITLMKLYEKKGEITINGREIFGLIYLVIDWETHTAFFTQDGYSEFMSKAGRTEQTLPERVSAYKSRASEIRADLLKKDPIMLQYIKKQEYLQSIYRRLNDLHTKGGDILIRNTIQWFPIEISLRTGRSKEHIEFDKLHIENLEQWWQNKLLTADPSIGYDQTTGMAGRHSDRADNPYQDTREINIPRIILNWRDIQNALEKGFTRPEKCAEYLTDKLAISAGYLGIIITSEILIENILYHWPGIIIHRSNNLRIYTDARMYCMGKLMQKYIEEGIVKEDDVANKFRTPDNPNGVSRKTIVRIALREFDVSSWAGAIAKFGHAPTKYALSKLTTEAYREAGGQTIQDYWKRRISIYVIQGYTPHEMIDEGMITEFSYKTLIRMIGDYQHEGFWGSFKNAKREEVAPIVLDYYRRGLSDEQIVDRMEFFQRAAQRPHEREEGRFRDPILSLEYHLRDWYDDECNTPTKIREFLMTHTLREFFDRYSRGD